MDLSGYRYYEQEPDKSGLVWFLHRNVGYTANSKYHTTIIIVIFSDHIIITKIIIIIITIIYNAYCCLLKTICYNTCYLVFIILKNEDEPRKYCKTTRI